MMIQATLRIVSISMVIKPTFQASLNAHFSVVDRVESGSRKNRMEVKFLQDGDKMAGFQDQTSEPKSGFQDQTSEPKTRTNRSIHSASFFPTKSRNGLRNSRIILKISRKSVIKSRRTSIPDLLFIRNNGISTVHNFLTSRRRETRTTRAYFKRSDRVSQFEKFVNSGKLW